VVLLLDPYVDAVLLLALAFLIVGIMRSLTPFLSKIPWVGGAIANAADGMAKAIAHACGIAFQGVDHALGASFHAVARFLSHSWSQLRSHAHLLLLITGEIGLIAGAIHAIRVLAEHASTVGAGIRHAVKVLQREFHGIEHRVKTLEREIGKGIGHDLRIHIKALEKWEEAAKAQLAADAKAIATTIPATITDLKNFLGIRNGTDYLTWAAGIVTAALGIRVFRGLKCDNLANNLDNRGCSMWGALDDLLGLLALGVIAADFDELVHEAQDLTEGAITVFDEVFGLSR